MAPNAFWRSRSVLYEIPIQTESTEVAVATLQKQKHEALAKSAGEKRIVSKKTSKLSRKSISSASEIG